MIKDLYIENFRGFDKLKIDNIKKINFLVGKNNCGKTSVLESIILMSVKPSLKYIFEVNRIIRKMNSNISELNIIFNNFDYTKNINFQYSTDNITYNILIMPTIKDTEISNIISELKYDIHIYDKNNNECKHYTHDLKSNQTENIKKYSNIKGKYITSFIIDDLTTVIKEKKEQQLIEMVSFFNNNIKAVNILKNDIYINIEGINELISLNLMGDGLKKYLSIILPIVANKYNTILVDEIENGLHHKTIKHLLKSILNLSKNNDIQMFFTTHSYEVLKFLSKIVNDEFSEIKDTVNVINIVNTENKGFQSYNYDMDSVKELLENDSDIRY